MSFDGILGAIPIPAQLEGSNVAWANQTTIHPLAVLAGVLAALLLLGLRRASAVCAIIAVISFISPAQRVVIGGLDISLVRALVAVGLLRVVVRGEYRGLRLTLLDGTVLLCAFSGAVAYSIQWGTVQSMVYKSGIMVESLGMYAIFRMLVRDADSVMRFAKYAAIVSIPVACALMIEKGTGRNVFSIFGGVPEITRMREGKLRAQGAFAHAIIAGTFWATLWPIMATLWWYKGARALAVASTIATIVIIVCCASSTPLGVFACAMVVMMMWRLRAWFPKMAACGLLFLAALHVSMQAPVWHLLARIDLVGGSTGWHRYLLIDSAIRRFDEWALVGLKSTSHWGPSQSDVANQYVIEGVRGGFSTFLLFLGAIGLAYVAVHKMMLRAGCERLSLRERVIFALGVSLVAHCVAFFGVAYFGQAVVTWNGLLGIIASMQPNAWKVNVASSMGGVRRSESSMRQAAVAVQ